MMSRLAVVLLVWLATLGPLAAAEAVFPAGSHIGLVPPPGMQPSQTFPGFEDRERKSGILINELPGPAYEQFLKSMSSGAINLPGVSNAKREILLTDGGAAHLVTGEQEADGTRFRKWLLISRRTVTSHDTDLSFSFVVTAQVPLDASEVYSDEAIRKSLGTIALRAAVPPEEVLAQMPFRLSEIGRFDTVRALIPGRAIILTEGAAGIETMQRPYLMISIGSGAPSQADQRGEFAQNVLRNIQGFRNLRMTYAEAIRIGGQPGYEIRLEGHSEINNSDVIVVQWLRFAGSAFLRLVGVTPKAQWGDSFPRFRAVRDGIAPR
jgi:hypothetical protein